MVSLGDLGVFVPIKQFAFQLLTLNSEIENALGQFFLISWFSGIFSKIWGRRR